MYRWLSVAYQRWELTGSNRLQQRHQLWQLTVRHCVPLVACSSTLCALPRCASQQLVRGAAGDDVVDEQVGDVVEGAGAGGLAVQAPPHVCQELLGEGRPGGLAGDPARPWPCSPECGGGGWLGLQLSRPWSMCRRAVEAPHSWRGSGGGPWCPGSLITSSCCWWGPGNCWPSWFGAGVWKQPVLDSSWNFLLISSCCRVATNWLQQCITSQAGLHHRAQGLHVFWDMTPWNRPPRVIVSRPKGAGASRPPLFARGAENGKIGKKIYQTKISYQFWEIPKLKLLFCYGKPLSRGHFRNYSNKNTVECILRTWQLTPGLSH